MVNHTLCVWNFPDLTYNLSAGVRCHYDGGNVINCLKKSQPTGNPPQARPEPTKFWSKIGVTQSGGSRYESGRNMPKPVRELLRLVHIEQVDLSKVKREDFEIIEYLRDTTRICTRACAKLSKPG